LHKKPSLHSSDFVAFDGGVVMDILVVSPWGVEELADDELAEVVVEEELVEAAVVVDDDESMTLDAKVEELCSFDAFAAIN
jgi:hypothetical protein